MTLEEFTRDINEYIPKAEALEQVRRGLVKQLYALMKDLIIPQVEPLLPEHYSINVGKCDVYIEADSVPINPQVNIRLMYKLQPIYYASDQDIELRAVQQQLDPQLKDIAKKYSLDHIYIGGEPVLIG